MARERFNFGKPSFRKISSLRYKFGFFLFRMKDLSSPTFLDLQKKIRRYGGIQLDAIPLDRMMSKPKIMGLPDL